MSTSDDTLAALRTKYRPRMKANTPGKLKYGRTFLIGLAFMTSSIAWTYYNFIMPILLKDYFRYLGVREAIDLFVGIVMVLDNIVAIFMLPIFGSLSDRTKSRFGKRTPYIMLGASSSIIAFSVVGLISSSRGVGIFVGLICIIVWFNLSMAFYRSASVSLMPDVTDPEVRSTGNAIVNIMGAVSMVIGLMISPLMGAIYDVRWIAGENASRAGGFYIVSISTAIALIILLLTVKETPTGDKFMIIGEHSIAIDPITLEYIGEQETAKKEPVLESLRNIFREKEKSTLFMLFVIFTWFFGYNAIDTFYSVYATSFLALTEAQASSALSIAPITMIISAVFAGKLAEKIGRKRTILIGIISLSTLLLVTMFVRTSGLLPVMFGLVGIAYGMININTIVIIWQLAPEGKIGAYTGSYYFFSQLSASLSPVVAGGAFSLYKLITQCPDGQQYILLFPYVILWEIIAILCLLRVKRGEARSFTGKQVKKLQTELGADD